MSCLFGPVYFFPTVWTLLSPATLVFLGKTKNSKVKCANSKQMKGACITNIYIFKYVQLAISLLPPTKTKLDLVCRLSFFFGFQIFPLFLISLLFRWSFLCCNFFSWFSYYFWLFIFSYFFFPTIFNFPTFLVYLHFLIFWANLIS